MRLDPWTFVLQVVNFLVLLWFLQRFLYRPVLAVIGERRKRAEQMTSEVEAERRTLEAQRNELQAAQAALAAERDSLLAAARDSAEAERKALLAKARTDAEAVRAEAERALAREREDVAAEVGRHAARLGVDIARRLLADTCSVSAQALMLAELCRDLRALSPDTRRGIADSLASGGPAPRIVSACPLDDAAAQTLGRCLSEVMGAPVVPEVRVDPGLIAGAEIRLPFTILRRSWADSLQRIQGELTDDGHVAHRP